MTGVNSGMRYHICYPKSHQEQHFGIIVEN